MPQLSQSSAVDYYNILGLPREATSQQICQAYRLIALRNHPILEHNNKNQAFHRFSQAAEAFDVLYDKEKKAIYDQYGDQVLREGLIVNGELVGKYKFITDPEEVFEKFFGSRNVYDHLLDIRKGDKIDHPIFASQYSDAVSQKSVKPLVVQVECLLTELFNGCTKTITYTKNVLSADGQNTSQVKQTKSIEIVPGSSSESDIVFEGQGHQEPGYPQSDLIFRILEINQKKFRRKGSDLIYEEKISLMDALDSKSITITQLNGQKLQLHFDEIINPQTRRVVQGKGMPIDGQLTKRGDLIVTFQIEFPEELPLEKKAQIIKLLTV